MFGTAQNNSTKLLKRSGVKGKKFNTLDALKTRDPQPARLSVLSKPKWNCNTRRKVKVIHTNGYLMRILWNKKYGELYSMLTYWPFLFLFTFLNLIWVGFGVGAVIFVFCGVFGWKNIVHSFLFNGCGSWYCFQMINLMLYVWMCWWFGCLRFYCMGVNGCLCQIQLNWCHV